MGENCNPQVEPIVADSINIQPFKFSVDIKKKNYNLKLLISLVHNWTMYGKYHRAKNDLLNLRMIRNHKP